MSFFICTYTCINLYIQDQSTLVYRSGDVSVTTNMKNALTPGEFIRIGGQEFRVCLNQDAYYSSIYGNLSSIVIPLCDVVNPFESKQFDVSIARYMKYNIIQCIMYTIFNVQPIIGGIHRPLDARHSDLLPRYNSWRFY